MTGSINQNDARNLYFAALSKRRAGNLADAEIFCRKSIEIDPSKLSSRVVLGEILLAQGKYIEGYQYFDSWPDLQEALGLSENPRMPFPRWQGEPLDGKSLLVLPLQGYGDQIQYARFLNDLAHLGAEVTAVVPPELSGIFTSLSAHIVPLRDGIRISIHDYWTYPISIARWLQATPDKIAGTPYLGKRVVEGSKVGIAWSGNPSHPNDANRSASREAFLPFFENFDVIELGIENTGPRTFLETASMLDECRAVVSVDTSVVHLAGAVGCPCYLMLSATDPDWRWMNGRRTHWYNSIMIDRQDVRGEWAGPIGRIVNSLQE